MARTVATPGDALVVCYRDVSELDDEFFSEDWEDYLEWIRETAMRHWPSFSPVERWAGRELRVLLENGHGCIGASVYGDLVAIWLVPRGDNPLHAGWCGRIADKFRELFGEYELLAVACNGEGFYQKIEK